MTSKSLKAFLLVAFVFYQQSPGTTKDLASEQNVIDATWRLYAWQVLGWQYDSPLWVKGSEETAEVGQRGQTYREKDVRAVCLGSEGDFYVFFTLRSFLDPAFPNLFLQGVHGTPLDSEKQAFSERAIENQQFVRYGKLQLVHYEDVGGGTFKITHKVEGVTHLDPKNPESHGRRFLWTERRAYEDVNGVRFQVPHKKISARDHLDMQKGMQVAFKYVGQHDVALLFVRKSAFASEVAIDTLGINNPTISVRMMLEHGRELFGFKFVLIGQETIDLIKNYAPNGDYEDLHGFQKLFMVAGVALDVDILGKIYRVSAALDALIPDRLPAAQNRMQLGQLAWDELGSVAAEVARDEDLLAKVRNTMLSAISPPILREPR